MAMEGIGRLFDVCLGGVPVDLSTAGITGKYVDMSQATECTLVFFKAAGTAGDDPTVTLKQASDSSGTGAKNLASIDHYYQKDAATLAASTQWTKVTQAAAATITGTGLAAHQTIWAIPVHTTAMDVANGFTHLRLDCGDVGTNAQLGCILYIRSNLEVGRTPANLASTA